MGDMAARNEIEAEAAKPMDWFKHDASAYSDIKCRRLLRRLGMAGYGRWWRLCEIMASTNGHKPSIETEEDAEILAEELQLDSVHELMEYLRVLVDVGLIQMPGDGTVSSDRMMSNALTFGTNRANGKLGGRPRKRPVKTDH